MYLQFFYPCIFLFLVCFSHKHTVWPLRSSPRSLEATYTHVQNSLFLKEVIFFYSFMPVFLLAMCFAGSSLGEAVHRQAFSEVPVWTPGCYARFSWLHSVLLIAAGLWKLGNRDCTTARLLTSPTFPHSHFQRFQRFWSADWL